MKMLLDVLTNLSIIIIICIALIDCIIFDNTDALSCKATYIIFTLVFFYPVLIITKHGNVFICVLTQGIYCLLAGGFLYDSSFDKEAKEKHFFIYSLSNFTLFAYCITGIYSIFFKTRLEKEYLINVFNKIKGIHYKEMFLGLIKNNWFHGICVGIISTVAGGLILNKIISSRSKDKNKNTYKKDV